jgi:general stress protein 26
MVDDLIQRILEILSRLQLASLATVTKEGKPWVRYVMVVADETLTIRCATFLSARKVVQIRENPEVHLTCGVTDPTVMKPYLQVQARAEVVTDEAQRHGFWNNSLQGIFTGPDDPNYGVLVMTPYRVEHCTPGSFEPEVWEA